MGQAAEDHGQPWQLKPGEQTDLNFTPKAPSLSSTTDNRPL